MLHTSIREQFGESNYIFLFTFQVTHLVTKSAPEPSYRVSTGIRYGIPIVSIDYIGACIEQGKLLDTDQFLVFGVSAASQFESGKIAAGNFVILSYQIIDENKNDLSRTQTDNLQII